MGCLSPARRIVRRVLWPLAAAAALQIAACGGGGGAAPGAGTGRDDPTTYSSQPGASLAGAEEAAAVTSHTIVLGGRTLAYTATAGHLIAFEPTTGAAQASVFYVAYELDGADPASRPVTFFYNGGPGSASVWLHLGSFGPKRLATGVPATTATRPFPLVDNADSLLDTTDLVFVNAVGSGRSQAISPFANRDFWGVDADAALFRDAILRWLALHGRGASPLFLYGESYGGPRTAVLARRLQEAGVAPDGLVLQSPAMDYHANCGVGGGAAPGCAGYLPSYAAVGAWHGLTDPVPDDPPAWWQAAVDFVQAVYAPALADWLASATPVPSLWPVLADTTGLAASEWQRQFNMDPLTYRRRLRPGELLGRYDGRMAAPLGSALAAEGDPSSSWIGPSFAGAIDRYLRDTLRYRNGSTYVLLSNAIEHWDFSHAGRALPDTVPDLAAALAHDPALRVLALSGVYDLATPFDITERDLARLASARVSTRRYPGGHMSFLDDATRPLQKTDLVAFYAQLLALSEARRAPLGATGAETPGVPALPVTRRDRPRRVGTPPLHPDPAAVPEPALQATPCDPCVPRRASRAPGRPQR